ncbi:MAG: translation initiation factor IF-3 [Endomicrobium sp.]|jgi:translation initiation factor IF-3|nr:translation initiation factor IF-3 [Endomicrobium sp.]
MRISSTRGGIVEDKKFRINYSIKVPEVRLIGSDGKMFGVLRLSDALSKAQSEGLDLVEISPHATPPVCKIINFSKFKYELEKKGKESRKKHKVLHVKEVRIRPRIGKNDLDIKIKRARHFITEGDKVCVTVMFSGREVQHRYLGNKIIDKIKDSLVDIASPEGKVSVIGTRLFLTFIPQKIKKTKKD